MRVILRSANGKRKYTVNTNDRWYSNFFSDLREATGSIPNAIRTPSYVMEQMNEWARLKRSLTGNPSDLWPPVYLADVEHVLGYLANPDVRTLSFVAVDNRTPREARRRHYSTVGRYLRENKVPRELLVESDEYPEHLHEDFRLTYDPVYLSKTDEQLEECLALEWVNVATGMKQTAFLSTQDRMNGELPWSVYNWQDVLDYVNVDWYDIPRERSNTYQEALARYRDVASPCRDVVYAMAGVRAPTVPEQERTYDHHSWGTRLGVSYYFSRGIEEDYRAEDDDVLSVYVTDWKLLYDRILSAATQPSGEAIYSSVQFGLSVLLTRGDYETINYDARYEVVAEPNTDHATKDSTVWSLLPMIHLCVLLGDKADYEGATLTDDEFPAAIQRVLHTLGISALLAMVATLFHYSSDDKKALRFCEVALEQLS